MALKTDRTVSLLSWHVEQQAGVIRVTEGGAVDLYRVDRLEVDRGDAFRVSKVRTGDGGYTLEPSYDVLLDGDSSTCDCKGFTRFGYCRHVSGLLALVGGGKLLRGENA